MKIQQLMALTGAAAIAVTLSACGSGASAGDANGKDYQVVVLGGLSADGILADNSATSVQAAKAGVEKVNATGGIDGRHVTIQVIDDKADPTTAVTKLRQVIAQDKPDLVLDSGPSTVASAIMPILKQSNILSFNIGPFDGSSDPSKFPLNFDIAQSPTEQLAPFGAYFKSKGYRTVGILNGSSAFGQLFGNTAASVLAAAGIKVVAHETYNVTALDMTPQLSAIQSKNPDAMLLDAYGAPLGYVLQGVQKLGWSVPIVGDTSVGATSLISQAPPNGIVGTAQAKNLVMEVLQSQVPKASATATNEAVTLMRKSGPIKAGLIMAANYDAPLLVQAAAKAAQSTDPEKIARELIDPKVLASVHTAMLSAFHYTAQQHSPHVGPTEYTFIPPAVLKDGQFH